MNYLSFKYKGALLSFMTILLIFLVIADVLIVSKQRSLLMDEVHSHMLDELDLIGSFVREPLIMHDYAKVEQFLKQWAEEHKGVVSLKAVMPNNFVLVKYSRSQPAEHVYFKQKEITYAGRKLISLSLARDAASEERILRGLQFQLITFSIVLTLILGVVLWRTMYRRALKPLEREIAIRKQTEELLQKAKNQLETRVQERTRELRAANEKLLKEIEERKRIEGIINARVKQQEIVAKIGQQALAGGDISLLLDESVRLVAETMQVEYCKVLELLPEGDSFLLRAGVGWKDGLVGKATVDAGNDSQAGYTLLSTAPVIVRDISNDSRFSGPSLLRDHGVVSGMSVIIHGKDRPFGVMGVHTTRYREFTNDDVNFLQAVANVLAEAIERRKADEALHLSEEKFEKAFRSSPTLISISTVEDGRYIDVNDAFLNASGYKREEIIGRSAMELGIWVDPSDRERLIKQLQEQGGVYNQEVRLRMKSGKIFTVLYSSELINIKNEPCLLAVKLDITERKRLEKQLLQAQKMEAVGQLAGGIAHDFNNILTAIISYSYLIKNRIKEDGMAKDSIDKILSLADRASQITQGLLTFSRKQYFEFMPTKINDLIRNIEKLLTKFIGEDIQLKTSLTNKEPSIMADRTQIEQIIMNLATNARDAMPEGGTLTIETDLVEIDDNFVKLHGFGEPGTYVLLSITDTGVGMDEETRQKIFEPFFTTKEIGKGTGLGLSIIYGIVKQHNGYINVYSEPGKGATFRIYLPEIKKSVEWRKAENLPDLKGRAETVLVAEDEAAVRESIKTILKEFNYKVIEAADGRDAVEKFMAHRDKIKLLILDVIMPKMNGKEAYERIRQVQPDIRVIFTSGYTADIIHKKKILERDVVFISKPIMPDNLLSKIREVLGSDRKGQ